MSAASPDAHLLLWPGQALYTGPGVDTAFHAHHALQIGLSLEAPFRVRTVAGGPVREQPTFVAWPGLPHEVACAGATVVFIWLEVPSHRPAPGMTAAAGLPQVDRFDAPDWHQRWPGPNPCVAGAALIASLARPLLAWPDTPDPDDARVRSALDQMRDPAIFDLERPIEHLAHTVRLSPSRLRHLFRDQMGLALQRYLLWRRLIVAVRALTDGADLTRSAHAAGFADSAHFSRTFRRMFGLAPSVIFNPSHSVQAHLCDPA